METKYIQEFLALAEMGSSYAAAEKLFCSQSSLVRHIQTIEEEFGCPMFDRTRRGFALNANGRVFLPYAEKIAMLQAQCFKALGQELDVPDTIRLSAECKIIDLLMDFAKEYSDYKLDYHNHKDIERQLLSGDIEVAFLSHITASTDELIDLPFYQEEVLVLMGRDHPMADRESISLEELRSERFVALCEDIVFDDVFLEMFKRVGFTQEIMATVPIPNDLMRMIREGIGITLIHGDSRTANVDHDLRAVPLDPPIAYEVRLCYKRNVALTKPAEDFVNYARKWRIRHPELDLTLLK